MAEDFREGRVEEKERFKYFLATSILWGLGSQPLFNYGRTFKIADLISAAVVLTTAIVGTILCYRANRSGDNTDFIGRMICLNRPISINVAVLFVPIGLGAFGFMHLVLGLEGSSKAVDVLGILLGGLSGIYYYWLIYKHVTLIAHTQAAENPD